MTIALVALLESGENQEPALAWLRHLLHALAHDLPGVSVLLLTNQPEAFSLPGATMQVVAAAPPRGWWQRMGRHRQWRALLQRHGARHVLFFGFSSYFKTQLPQALILTAADFNKKRVLRLRKPDFSTLPLFVANEAARENLGQLLGANRSIAVLRGKLPEPALVEADTQVVKDRFTEGAEFFLYQGMLSDTPAVVNLLKAFSRFKRRQKSGWKLVLLAEGEEAVQPLQELLSSYKYREDVLLATGLTPEEVESLYAAAWCFVCPAAPPYWGTALVRAIRWALPVVGTAACREWAGNAGLYFEAGDEVQLAEHLMHIYKDENIHRQMREATLKEQVKFGWQPLLQRLQW